MDKKEFDKGYHAAIEAIKKQLQQGNSGDDAVDKANQDANDGLDNNSSNSSNNNDDQSDNDSNSSGLTGQSRTSSNDQNKGIVRPEDCIGPSDLNLIPDTPGTMMDRATGDKIVEKEGYEKEGGTDDNISKDWKDKAMKAARGSAAGKFKSKIDGLYKTVKDWKKELKKVVGYSISPDEKRSAYTNKNILISQDRLARTDKDKYENVDYIIACVDSSGSMSDNDLKVCLSEVYSVALLKKPLSIYVIQCDTEIQSVLKFDSILSLKKEIQHATVKGRGGTDFQALWRLLKTDRRFKNKRAELVMLFTDGWCTQYKRDPRTMLTLCWVILDNTGFDTQYREPNTKVVYINTKDIKL